MMLHWLAPFSPPSVLSRGSDRDALCAALQEAAADAPGVSLSVVSLIITT